MSDMPTVPVKRITLPAVDGRGEFATIVKGAQALDDAAVLHIAADAAAAHGYPRFDAWPDGTVIEDAREYQIPID